MYAAARDASRAKKKARQDRYAVPDTTLPPLPDPSAEGGRKISKAIEKNRGLTPHRSNAIKNPRVKHKWVARPVQLAAADVLLACC
jgi:U3 small nucleolar RNA-associated protein 3